MRVKSGGKINIPGLTASKVVGTDSGKDLVSLDTMGSGYIVQMPYGAAGQVITSNGGSTPTWETPTTVSNVAGGTAGSIPYQTAPGTTACSAAGSSGQLLASGGTSAPTWVNTFGSGSVLLAAASAPLAGYVLVWDSSGPYWSVSLITTAGVAAAAGATAGTALSNAATAQTSADTANTAITSLTGTLRAPNLFYAGPVSGVNTPAFFRTIDPADIANFSFINPNIGNASGTSLNLSDTLYLSSTYGPGLQAKHSTAYDYGIQIFSSNIGDPAKIEFENTATAQNARIGLSTTGDLQITVTTGKINIPALTASSALATDASKNLVSIANTGTGNNVLATSPALTTPNIGVATGTTLSVTSTDYFPFKATQTSSSGGLGTYLVNSGNSTSVYFASSDTAFQSGAALIQTGQATDIFLAPNNLTAMRIKSGGLINIPGLTASSAVATDASKNLVSVANTGTGNNVLATSPALTTPNIGAAAGTSLQLTGLTASSALATDASKNLVSIANTGTGNNVLATSPSLLTPDIGYATGTSLTVTGYDYFPLTGIQTNSVYGVGTLLENSGNSTNVYYGLSDPTFQSGAALVSTGQATDIFLAPNDTTAMRIKSGGQINIPGLTASKVVGTDSGKNLVSLDTMGSGYIVQMPYGTLGQVLTSNGGSTPTWETPTGGSTNVTGGTAGSIPYQTAPGATSCSLAGTAGQILKSGGTGSPTWTSTTGSGNVVLATSPSLTTPNIGVATGTSLAVSGTTYFPLDLTQTSAGSGLQIRLQNTSVGTPGAVAFGLSDGFFQQGAAFISATNDVFIVPGGSTALRIKSGGLINIPGLTASSAVATDASKNLVSVANTGTGNNVLATSPALTTPNIGAATGSSLSLTSSASPWNAVQMVQTGTGNLAICNFFNSTDNTAVYMGLASSQFQAGAGLIQTAQATDIFLAPNSTTAMRIKSGGQINIPGLSASSLVATDASKNLVSTNAYMTGGAPNLVILTGSGTYNVSSGCRYYKIVAVGAGGGGGYGSLSGLENAAGGGGGSGGYSIFYTSRSANASFTYTCGTGGAAGGGGSRGNDGVGNTVVTLSGVTLTANPGQGGWVAGIGGAAGNSYNGLAIVGNPGSPGCVNRAVAIGGNGGIPYWGGAAQGQYSTYPTSANGTNAVIYGGGGSGGSGGSGPGGAGGNGAIQVEEFF